MSTVPSLPGCPTCTVTIDSSGAAHHEAGCVSEQLQKHKSVLHRIAHLLKEIGITAVEVPVDVIVQSDIGGN